MLEACTLQASSKGQWLSTEAPQPRPAMASGTFTTQSPCKYLKGQGDLVSRLITPITHIVTLLIPVINLLPKSPDPPSKDSALPRHRSNGSAFTKFELEQHSVQGLHSLGFFKGHLNHQAQICEGPDKFFPGFPQTLHNRRPTKPPNRSEKDCSDILSLRPQVQSSKFVQTSQRKQVEELPVKTLASQLEEPSSASPR